MIETIQNTYTTEYTFIVETFTQTIEQITASLDLQTQ